ncbi:hypothetical protein C1H46_038508 [Malus baccata]|uniref:Protein kinase domain-containing protein n=1 Tax=Malus baccata TaxID=106549 RepID=A0A540KP32_MALBA|nr:hypothetical protein C1H46_038508 [Malus baccata]
MAEYNALRNIRHRNLVKILTCCSSMDYNGNEFKALVFEYMSNGSLEQWLHRENQSRSLSLHLRLKIAVDVASALYHLHDHCEQPVIHCDLKLSNILLDDDMIAHVGDFGLARLISATVDSSLNQSSTVGITGTVGITKSDRQIMKQQLQHRGLLRQLQLWGEQKYSVLHPWGELGLGVKA